MIPYTLGIIEIPPQGRLQGYVLDQRYAGCPQADRLFVLEEVAEALPTNGPSRGSNDGVPTDWISWNDHGTTLTASFPDHWNIEETRNVGSIIDVRLQPEESQSVRLTVIAGETHWNPETVEEERTSILVPALVLIGLVIFIAIVGIILYMG